MGLTRGRLIAGGLLLMLSAALWLVFGGRPAYALVRRTAQARNASDKPLMPRVRFGRAAAIVLGGPLARGPELGPTGPTGFPGSQECGGSGPCQVGSFSGVSCAASTTCTAVGSGIDGTLGEDWDGTSWALDTTVDPGGDQYSTLSGVRCTSTAVCMAVGYGNGEMIGERKNGSTWVVNVMPLPSGDTSGDPLQVSCSAANACTAVGNAESSSGEVPLAERWNGSSWTAQTPALPAGATYASFSYVGCPNASACTAVGTQESSSGPETPLAESWDGTSWTVETTPLPAGATEGLFNGVSCHTAGSCTAVGWYVTSGTTPTEETLAERWNGVSWTVATTPNPSGSTFNEFTSVSCPTSTNCTAVGDSGPGPLLAEAWNAGAGWHIHPVHTPKTNYGYDSSLADVSCTSGTACMAVGHYTSTQYCGLTLAELWNGSTWTVNPTLSPIGFKSSYLRPGTVGHTYADKLSVCGGPGPYVWSVTGTLPTGLSLNTTTGAISGTPEDAGTWSFTLTAAQASNSGNSASIPTSILIRAGKATS